MKTRIVWTKIWEDEFFVELSRPARILFLYLITNQRTNLCGCYQVSDRTVCFDTKLTVRELEEAKEELAPKAIFYGGWVYLPNAQRLGGFKGEKNEAAIQREWEEVPLEVRNALTKGNHDRVSKSEDRVSPKGDTPRNHKSEIRNKKPGGIVKGGRLAAPSPEVEVVNGRVRLPLRSSVAVLNDPAVVQVLQGQFPEVEVVNELAKAKDWARSKGRVYRDYTAFARNWLRRAQEFKKQRRGGVLDARKR